MPLTEFVQNHPELKARFIPYEQTENSCFRLSNAWLQWFLSENFKEIGTGDFNDSAQLASTLNEMLPDCRDPGYILDLRSRISGYQLNALQPSLENYPDLKSAVTLTDFDYRNEGGLIFAKDSPNSPTNVGHTMCFGVRRSKRHPDKAIFGFFDANCGMLFIEIHHFPETGTELRYEVDLYHDTRLLFSTYPLHKAGQETIHEFFTQISAYYDYRSYHCDRIRLSRALNSPPVSPVVHAGNAGSLLFSNTLSSRQSLSPTSPSRKIG